MKSIFELKQIVFSNRLQRDVLRDLCGVPSSVIEAAENGWKREFPCPKCGGNTRFRIFDLESGSIYCSHCCRNGAEGSGDIIGAIIWAQGLTTAQAARKLEGYLTERGYIETARNRYMRGY